MKHLIGKNVLVTTQNWFVADDGLEYKALWGKLKAIHTTQDTLGFTPSRQNTNWFVEIGGMVIAGCQVLYLNACDHKPNNSKAMGWSASADKGYFEYQRPTFIFISED